jgi:hypothetical protein
MREIGRLKRWDGVLQTNENSHRMIEANFMHWTGAQSWHISGGAQIARSRQLREMQRKFLKELFLRWL